MKQNIETVEYATTEMSTLYLEDDPHRAALELNPEKSEELTWSTIFAVIVGTPSPFRLGAF